MISRASLALIALKPVAASIRVAVGKVRHRVVPAGAVLPRPPVAHVAVAVALAPPARAARPVGVGEEARLAALAARADGVAAAVDAHGLVLLRPQPRLLLQLVND